MTVNEMLDLARARHSLRSESALADRLGIPASQLAQYRNHSRGVDADLAWAIAELLGEPPADVIAVAMFEAETDPVKRARWRGRMEALGLLTA